MSIFERYLTVWVFLCIVAGVALGHAFPGLFHGIGGLEVAKVNLPVAALIWLMIIPMLVKIDFAALGEVRRHWRGIGVTLFINWAVKPFSMAALGWFFIGYVFRPYLPAEQINSYVAGLIILAAAPCTAMVFVWSQLTKGEPHFTLSQVALNDTIMVFAFAPIVGFLLGLSAITVPWDTLVLSVVLYIVLPVIAAQGIRRSVLNAGGEAALARLLATLQPLSLVALLATLVLLFGFQGEQILRQPAVIAHARRADPHSGLFQRGLRLSPEPDAGRAALRRGPVGLDRSKQFLRACGGGGDIAVRLQIGRGACDRRRRADRSAGHAERRLDREREPRLVRGAIAERAARMSGILPKPNEFSFGKDACARVNHVDRRTLAEAPNIHPAAFEIPDFKLLEPREFSHAPRILLLYGSCRSRSYSRFLTVEAARLLETFGAEARIFDPSGLPLPDDGAVDHPKVSELRELSDWSEGHVWCSPERHGAMTGIMKSQIDWIPLVVGAGVRLRERPWRSCRSPAARSPSTPSTNSASSAAGCG